VSAKADAETVATMDDADDLINDVIACDVTAAADAASA